MKTQTISTSKTTIRYSVSLFNIFWFYCFHSWRLLVLFQKRPVDWSFDTKLTTNWEENSKEKRKEYSLPFEIPQVMCSLSLLLLVDI
jgi:hypothetical protein